MKFIKRFFFLSSQIYDLTSFSSLPHWPVLFSSSVIFSSKLSYQGQQTLHQVVVLVEECSITIQGIHCLEAEVDQILL